MAVPANKSNGVWLFVQQANDTWFCHAWWANLCFLSISFRHNFDYGGAKKREPVKNEVIYCFEGISVFFLVSMQVLNACFFFALKWLKYDIFLHSKNLLRNSFKNYSKNWTKIFIFIFCPYYCQWYRQKIDQNFLALV